MRRVTVNGPDSLISSRNVPAHQMRACEYWDLRQEPGRARGICSLDLHDLVVNKSIYIWYINDMQTMQVYFLRLLAMRNVVPVA